MSKQRNIRVRGERRAFEVSRFMAALQALADQKATEEKDQGEEPADQQIAGKTSLPTSPEQTTDDQEAA
jgi:hypothetical protein